MDKIIFSGLLFFAVYSTAHAGNFINTDDPSLISGIADHIKRKFDELAILNIAENRTEEDCRYALADADLSLSNFFGPKTHLLSTDEIKSFEPLFRRVFSDNEEVVFKLKQKESRKRPFEENLIDPCEGGLALAGGSSFPSGHAAHAYLSALILGELYPERKNDLLERAKEIGDHRVVLGVHFPSDVDAGFKLAQRVFEKLNSNNSFRYELAEVRSKIHKELPKEESRTQSMPCIPQKPETDLINKGKVACHEAENLLNAISPVQVIDPSEFQEIKKVSEYLLRVCPPSTCVLIGSGRSPTPFIAYIQSMPGMENYTFNVPLSNFKYGVYGKRGLDFILEQKLYHHFDHYLPSLERLKGRSVLVFDFSRNVGHGALAAHHYINSYYNHKSGLGLSRPKVESALLSGWFPLAESEKTLDELTANCNHIIFPLKGELIGYLNQQKYDNFAKFGEYHIDRIDNDNTQNPKYQALVSELKTMRESSPSHRGRLFSTDFVIIEQLHVGTLSQAKAKKRVMTYINQLNHYKGSDLENRYHELLQDPEAKYELFENIDRIKDDKMQNLVVNYVVHEEEDFQGLHAIFKSNNLKHKYSEILEKHFKENPSVLKNLLKELAYIAAAQAISPAESRTRVDLMLIHTFIAELSTPRRSTAVSYIIAIKPDDEKSFQLLIKLLGHSSPDVRISGAKVLQSLGPSKFLANHSHDLVVALKDESPAVRNSISNLIKTMYQSSHDYDKIQALIGGTHSETPALADENVQMLLQLMDSGR